RIVHRHQQPLSILPLPGTGQETIPRPVALPGRHAFKQLPLTVAYNWLAQHGQQSVVELFQSLVDWFLWTTNQMRRDAFLASRELSLVKESQPWRQESDDCRGFLHLRRERRRRPRLVVVFQEAGELILVIQPRVEMLAHRSGVTLTQAIIQPFVVGV